METVINQKAHISVTCEALLLAATVCYALPVACHAVLYKRESRSALLWVSLIASLPVVMVILRWWRRKPEH